jgi:sulfatase maturation enzyme AslB (radical SAM superfamily)
MRTRYESFGGIISLENPPTLIYVDKVFMKSLGYDRSKLWKKKRNYLSAPTEVHFSITNECPLRCKHCYVEAGEKLSNELTLNEVKSSIDLLAEMGVYSIWRRGTIRQG